MHVAPSFPSRNVVVARSLPKAVRRKIALQLGQIPNPLLVFRQPGEGLEVFLTQEIESLQVVGQDEVEPGESPSDILLVSENPIKFGQVGLESFNAAVSGLVEGVALVISPIDHLDVFGVEVLVDPVGSEESDLLISVAPE